MASDGKLFIEERLEKIMDSVRQRRKITVEEAIEICGVSADTIRRDFNRLAGQDMVLRTHGGIMVKDNSIYDSSTQERKVRNSEQKIRIAGKALEFISDGETIALDAGTTTTRLAMVCSDFQHLTVLCYSLDVANEMIAHENITTMIVGGVIRNKTASAVGPDAVAMIKKMHTHKLFLGTNAIDLEKGLMTPNRMEAEIKEALIGSADEVILLADSSKFQKKALFPFGTVEDVDVLITDNNGDASFLEELRKKGVKVVKV